MFYIDLRLGSMENDWITISDQAFLQRWQSEAELCMKFEWIHSLSHILASLFG